MIFKMEDVENILVSIIVPVYNVERALVECVESILEQTYKNIELVLVDDGSTDRSVRICDDFAQKDSRVIVIHTQNNGVSKARLKGFESSQGDFVYFVDADDYLTPNAIQILLSKAIETKVDVVISEYNHVKNNGVNPYVRRLVGFYSKKDIDLFMDNSFLYDYITRKTIISIAIWGKLYKRNVLEGVLEKGIGIKYGEDVVITYVIMKRSQSIFVIKDCLYNYRVYEGGGLKRTIPDMYCDMEKVWKKLLEYNENKSIEMQFPIAITMFCKKILIQASKTRLINYQECKSILRQLYQMDFFKKYVKDAAKKTVCSFQETLNYYFFKYDCRLVIYILLYIKNKMCCRK